MSALAEPPPVIWKAPVSPVRITRAFRLGAPYAAGGHRGIDLRARPGQPVRSPCAGTVVFRGAVAGGPPTVTLRCGELRATFQRVQPAVGLGARVAAGATVAVASGTAFDLSARHADGRYLDPAALLGAAGKRVPPAAGPARRPARPAAPTPRAHVPARVVDRALVTPEGARAPASPATARRGADAPLGIAGSVIAGAALVALALTARRRARRRPGRAGRAVPARAQR